MSSMRRMGGEKEKDKEKKGDTFKDHIGTREV